MSTAKHYRNGTVSLVISDHFTSRTSLPSSTQDYFLMRGSLVWMGLVWVGGCSPSQYCVTAEPSGLFNFCMCFQSRHTFIVLIIIMLLMYYCTRKTLNIFIKRTYSFLQIYILGCQYNFQYCNCSMLIGIAYSNCIVLEVSIVDRRIR